ncbi:unnamed protein product, partial [Mycena citricolor]
PYLGGPGRADFLNDCAPTQSPLYHPPLLGAHSIGRSKGLFRGQFNHILKHIRSPRRDLSLPVLPLSYHMTLILVGHW